MLDTTVKEDLCSGHCQFNQLLRPVDQPDSGCASEVMKSTKVQTLGAIPRGAGRPRLIMHTLRDYVITATEQDGCYRFGSEIYEARTL